MKLKKIFKTLIDDFTESTILFCCGIVVGIIGYFLYYKEEIDRYSQRLPGDNLNELDPVFSGSLGGLFSVVLFAALIGIGRKRFNADYSVWFVVGGLAILILVGTLDLFI